MSTAAHAPRHAGSRRPGSPSGSKVTPRRNAPEASDSIGIQYDSDEVPVLIRLPNLRDVSSVETRPTLPARKKHQSIDGASEGKRKAAKHNEAKVSKKSFQQQAGDNKLVLGGIVGGILVVVMLFLFNSNRLTPPTDPDAWASEAAELESQVQEPEVSIPTENEPQQLYPGFAYEAPSKEAAQFASGETEKPSLDIPNTERPGPQLPIPVCDVPGPQQPETAALPSKLHPVTAWPSDEAMGLQSTSGSQPVDGWPGESTSPEQSGYENVPADSPSQADYRSSKYPSGAESYRMGKLESERPQATPGQRSSILDGNIEIPDTTSTR